MSNILKPTILEVNDLPELWVRALWELWNKHSGDSREYKVEHGSFANQHSRKEFDYFMAHVKNPAHRPLYHELAPTNLESIEQYFLNYIIGTEITDNEEYTYGSRLNIGVDTVIEMLKETPNTNQAILQVGSPFDIEASNPPCLRHIDCRVKDNKLHFMIYFRSWDLYAGLPENLGGLQFLKEYMAQEIGAQDGEMIVSSKGLHVYDYSWKDVEDVIKFNGWL